MKKTLVIVFFLSLFVTVQSHGLVRHESAGREPGQSDLSSAGGDTGTTGRSLADLHRAKSEPAGARQVIAQRHEHGSIRDKDEHTHSHGRDTHKHGNKPKSKYDLRDMRPVDSHKHDHGQVQNHKHDGKSHDNHHGHDHSVTQKSGHAHGTSNPDGDTHESHDHDDLHHHGHDGHEGHSHEGVYNRLWDIGTNG